MKFSLVPTEELMELRKARENPSGAGASQRDEIQNYPEGYGLQISPNAFDFEIITSLPIYQQHWEQAISDDLIRDVTDGKYSEMTPEQFDVQSELPKSIHVVQKSFLWLELRNRAHGTASSVGKYLLSGERFPTQAQIIEQWTAKLRKDPFEKTLTTAGHMKWGVTHEDVALLSFVQQKNLCVTQVGTINVSLNYIHNLIPLYFGRENLNLDLQQALQEHPPQHLLISPDGIVSSPEPDGNKKVVTGMLEIKCISPFHHLPSDDHKLIWCADMDRRQWYKVIEIPYVYVIQMCLQAISGRFFYQMNDSSIMWFIRWAPNGYSLFSFPFGQLIRMGILAAELYFSILNRIHDASEVFPYTPAEHIVNQMLRREYLSLQQMATHEYHELHDYDSFYQYQRLTKHHRFVLDADSPNRNRDQIPRDQIPRGQCLL